MTKLALLAALAVLVMTNSAMAWDNRGHMMVAAIAYDQLTPATKARVARLLELNEYPVNGDKSNVVEANGAKAAFMMAATAPDAIKSDSNFVDDGDNASTAEHPDLNVGFSDDLMHRYWHFADTAFFAPGAIGMLPKTPGVNAQERIRLFRQTLASNAPDELKSYDLVWILHIVGDVHQPLHDVSRITSDKPDGDRGGNDVKLCLVSTASCGAKLHSFWDDAAGTGNSVKAAITAACALEFPADSDAMARAQCEQGTIVKPSLRPEGSSISDETVWVDEGVETAKAEAYKSPPIGSSTGPFLVDQDYKDNAHRVAREKILLAGARLADLLNNELK